MAKSLSKTQVTALAKQILADAGVADPHPLIVETAEGIARADGATDDYGFVRQQGLDIRVTPDSVPRALRIMDMLVKAIEARGWEVKTRVYWGGQSCAAMHGHNICFDIKEQLRRRELPEEGERQRWAYDPTGQLSLRISRQQRSPWSDRKNHKIEGEIESFVLEMEALAERYAHGDAERAQMEEEKKRREAQAREEERRFAALRQEAANWHESKLVRSYLEALHEEAIRRFGKIDPDSKLDQWLKWAHERADELDPLTQ